MSSVGHGDTNRFQRIVLDITEVGWCLCKQGVEAPVLPHVSYNECNEWRRKAETLKWWEG